VVKRIFLGAFKRNISLDKTVCDLVYELRGVNMKMPISKGVCAKRWDCKYGVYCDNSPKKIKGVLILNCDKFEEKQRAPQLVNQNKGS